MHHRLAAAVTVRALRARDGLAALARRQEGQGTVEYVGLILLIAGVLAAVVVWGHGFRGDQLGKAITDKLQSAIDNVGAGPGG